MSNLIRKKIVFKRLQKLVFVVIALRSGGRTFHALGPATTNALSAVRVLVLCMRKSPRLVERNRLSVQTLRSSARYAGAEPSLTSNISTHSLYIIRLSTNSQCRGAERV